MDSKTNSLNSLFETFFGPPHGVSVTDNPLLPPRPSSGIVEGCCKTPANQEVSAKTVWVVCDYNTPVAAFETMDAARAFAYMLADNSSPKLPEVLALKVYKTSAEAEKAP